MESEWPSGNRNRTFNLVLTGAWHCNTVYLTIINSLDICLEIPCDEADSSLPISFDNRILTFSRLSPKLSSSEFPDSWEECSAFSLWAVLFLRCLIVLIVNWWLDPLLCRNKSPFRLLRFRNNFDLFEFTLYGRPLFINFTSILILLDSFMPLFNFNLVW